MRKQALGTGLIAIALLLTASWMAPRAFGQEGDSKDPFIGSWALNIAKSTISRVGVAPTHPARGSTRIFAVERDGYRVSVADDGSAAPARSYFFRCDGKEYPDPHGPGRGELATHWRLTPYVIVRLVKTNGKPTEWVAYAVSTDGNMLTTTEWAPEHPDYHTIQVWERQR